MAHPRYLDVKFNDCEMELLEQLHENMAEFIECYGASDKKCKNATAILRSIGKKIKEAKFVEMKTEGGAHI